MSKKTAKDAFMFDPKHPCGYIDINGNFVVKGMFDEAGDFEDGVAWVKQGTRWALVGKNGEFLYGPKRMTHGEFHEGLAWIKIGKNYGLINKSGEIVADNLPKIVDNFSRGYAMIEVDGKYGYIDKSGAIVIEPKFDNATNFTDYAIVTVNYKKGLIDKNGKYILEPIYRNCYLTRLNNRTIAVVESHFRDGLIDPATGENLTGFIYQHFWRWERDGYCNVKVNDKWGLIDKNLAYAIEPKYDDIGVYDKGIRTVELNGKEGAIDKTTALIIDTKFDKVRVLNDGDYFKVKLGDKWGILDKNGVEISEPKFEEVSDFDSKGRTKVKLDGKWGIISTDGSYFVEPKYDYIKYCRDYYALEVDGKWTVIDETLKSISDVAFDDICNLSTKTDTYIGVKVNGEWGVIDVNGDFVIEPKYCEIYWDYHYGDNLIIIEDDKGRRGLLDSSSLKVIFEPRFDRIAKFSDGLYIVEKNSRYGLFDSDGKAVLRMKYKVLQSFSEGLAYVEM